MELNDLITIQQIDGKAMTTSLEVAKRFGKRHDNVLRQINALRDGMKEDEEDVKFMLLNFEEHSYLDQRGNSQPMVYITRDGFAMLAMSFTGLKANSWRRKFIDAFNKMESFIRINHVQDADKMLDWGQMRLLTKETRRSFTDIVKEHLIPLAVAQGSENSDKMYVTYTRMLNRAFVEDTGFPIPKSRTVRDYLDICDLAIFKRAEERLAKKIRDGAAAGVHYKEIYQTCKAYVQRLVEDFGPVSPVLPFKGPAPVLDINNCQLSLI